MVIEPESKNVVKVAPFLCVCEMCMTSYGSCPLFENVDLQSVTKPPNRRCLRKDMEESDEENEDNDEIPRNDDDDDDDDDKRNIY